MEPVGNVSETGDISVNRTTIDPMQVVIGPYDNQFRKSIVFILITGVIVSAVIAISIIFSAIYLAIKCPEKEVPEYIKTWGGVVIGFYFGSRMSFLKDILVPKFGLHEPKKESKKK